MIISLLLYLDYIHHHIIFFQKKSCQVASSSTSSSHRVPSSSTGSKERIRCHRDVPCPFWMGDSGKIFQGCWKGWKGIRVVSQLVATEVHLPSKLWPLPLWRGCCHQRWLQRRLRDSMMATEPPCDPAGAWKMEWMQVARMKAECPKSFLESVAAFDPRDESPQVIATVWH